MEQLKPFIEGLKANRFWIFCGVTLIGCVVVYYMVGKSLATEEAAATGKIKTTVTEVQSLLTAGVAVDPEAEEGNSQKAHPNQDTVAEMKKVVKAAAAATKEAWEQKYQLQSALQVFAKDTIRETQVNFKKFLPAESVAADADEDTLLPEAVRVNYRDRIRDELPKLAALIRSYWKPNYTNQETKPREVIIWNKDNQEYWNARYTNFVTSFNLNARESNVPRTLQVLYTTEDLWLLRCILKDVIGKTVFDKGDIYANDLAVIKEIDHILIGADAELSDQNLPGQGDGMDRARGGGMNSSKMGPGGGGGGGSSKKADSSSDPISGRYVDNKAADIPAKDYRGIYKGSTDKKKTHWKIAKRVKVRIGLQMDTREIQTLLANCANAPFPIEVRSLRVNKHKPAGLTTPGSASGKSGVGGMGSQGMQSGRGGGGNSSDRPTASSSGSGGGGGQSGGMTAPASGGGGSGGSARAQKAEKDDQGFTKPVEIFGYMYIYNKVDQSMFKILDDEKANP